MSFDHLWFEHFLPKGSIHCKDESVNVCGEVGHGHTQLWSLLRKLDLNPDLNIKDMFVSDLLVWWSTQTQHHNTCQTNWTYMYVVVCC